MDSVGPLSRSDARTLATYARAAERFDDMRAFVACAVDRASIAGELLTTEECELLAVAFKQGLTRARATLRILGFVQQHETNPELRGGVLAFVQRVADEILRLSEAVVDLAAERSGAVCEVLLSPPLQTDASRPPSLLHAAAESAVFCFKLAGDYCRYVAETHYAPGTVALYSDRALVFYSRARSYAAARLHAGGPAALGVALNFSVFLFEVRQCEAEARDLAATAVREALDALRRDARSHPRSGSSSSSGGLGISAAEDSGAPPRLSPAEVLESQAVLTALASNLHAWEGAGRGWQAAGASEGGDVAPGEGFAGGSGRVSRSQRRMLGIPGPPD